MLYKIRHFFRYTIAFLLLMAIPVMITVLDGLPAMLVAFALMLAAARIMTVIARNPL